MQALECKNNDLYIGAGICADREGGDDNVWQIMCKGVVCIAPTVCRQGRHGNIIHE